MLWERGKSYPQELRERVFVHAEAGLTVGAIARTLVVSVSYVSKVLLRRETTGETTARAQCCHLTPRLQNHEAGLAARVRARPDSTLAELCTWLHEEHQMVASVALMAKTMAKLGLTLKKRRCMRPNRTARTWPRSARAGGRDRPRLTRPN
jgi:transposase